MQHAQNDPLLQLFSNLLRNTFQAVEANGVVSVRFEKGTDNAKIKIYDNGPGFAPEIQNRIFNPLVSYKKEGLGLGLTICQRIVRSFGWTISASREGSKTCFTVQLPLTDVL